MTMAIFNSVLSSMMEEESSHSTPKQLIDLLHHKQFINSVLALSFFFLFFPLISSYDTSIYLLVNNNFDILSSLILFSVSPFDLQRVTDRFTDKLNQQSSQLVIGDVRNHFNRVGFERRQSSQILDSIIDWAIWKQDSEIWKYLGKTGAVKVNDGDEE